MDEGDAEAVAVGDVTGEAVAVGVAVEVGAGVESAQAGEPTTGASEPSERAIAAIQAVLFIDVFNACLFMRQPPR